MTEIDGVLRYDFNDMQAGLCDPAQIWRPVPEDKVPPATDALSQDDPAPGDGPPTARQLQKDVLAAYTKLGGVAYLTALADESPQAFLKLLVNALHQTPPANVDYSVLSREDHRQLQVAEQNAIINAHRAASNAGDAKASEVIIKASDRLAKLLGTDQPRLVANFNLGKEASQLSDAELEQIAAGGLTLVPDANGVYGPEE